MYFNRPLGQQEKQHSHYRRWKDKALESIQIKVVTNLNRPLLIYSMLHVNLIVTTSKQPI